MDKNVVWAVTLSALFLMVWYRFFQPVALPPTNRPSSSVSDQNSSSNKKEGSYLDLQTSLPLKKKEGKTLSEPEIEKEMETATTKIVIASRGAAIKHWWLKEKINGSTSDGKGWPDLVNGSGQNGQSSIPIKELPLSTFPDLNFKEVGSSSRKMGTIQSLWRAELPGGIEVEKRYIFEDSSSALSQDSHFMRLVLSFRNNGVQPVQAESFRIGWSQGLGTIESEKKDNATVTRALAYPSQTKEVAVFKTGEQKSDYTWMGLDNRYYLLAMLPLPNQFNLISTEKSKTNPGEIHLIANPFLLNSGESRSFELKIYAGPKGYTHLKKLGVGLEHSVDFGFFGFLGKWALKAMYSLHRLTANYGWAIIILTGIVQLIVFPLSLKSYQSMASMKKLQPRIQELQKRYKDDSKRMHQEMLSLYKEAKTNPFGGCLPMILQIPVFYAFFTMLRNAYELRGAPWIFWIQDLSQRDPYYILPVVMGGGMFLQQKISGTVGDPAQAKIMMFMPIIFTFMFLNFPSGLVLYWLTNSILSIATQYWCTKKFGSSAPAFQT